MTEAVKTFMVAANRPYSVNDVLQNLGNGVTKSGVQKHLDELVSKGVLFAKLNGKQKVYCAVQVDAICKKDEDLDKKLTELKNIARQVDSDYKQSESSLKLLLSHKTTDEVESENSVLESANESLRGKLNIHKSEKQESRPVDKAELDKALKRKSEMVKEYRKRKRICLDITGQILESYPKTKSCLFQDMGLEDDPKDMKKL